MLIKGVVNAIKQHEYYTKNYEHQHQREIRGKHQIGRPISWEPNIVGCLNCEWFYREGNKKTENMLWSDTTQSASSTSKHT